jgi:two-component system response regulator QseB
MRLLLIEDEIMLAEGVAEALKMNGYNVEWLTRGDEAEQALLMNTFDVCVLDIKLPGKDGLSVLRTIRQKGIEVPVLLLTACDQVDDRVKGLDAGADDYLTKPFDLSELYARLRALVRRASGRAEPVLKHRDIELDPSSHEVRQNGEPLNFSRREYAVLYCLLQNAGKVMSKEQLEEKLYGWNEDVSSNALEVHIHHLRRKLGSDLIKTIRGVGYMVK